MHIRSYNVLILSLRSLEPTSIDSKSCSDLQEASPEICRSFYKGDLYNRPCTLDQLMGTLKAYVLEITLTEIQIPALTSRKHLLNFSGHSTKGDL